MTDRQARLLAFIVDYKKRRGGVSPSYHEMARGVGVASKSGIHHMLERLEAGGHIARDRSRVRSIRVTEPAAVVTVADLRTAVGRLVEQEGVARAVAALLDIAGELTPARGEGR